MDTLRQLFFDKLTTTGTKLAGVARINQYHRSPSVFRFGDGALYELIPGYIGHAFVDGLFAVGLHAHNVQIFKHDDLVGIDQLAGLLMGKVLAPLGNALMDVVQGEYCFAPFRASLFQSGHLALDTFQVIFILLKPSLPDDLMNPNRRIK